MAKRQNRRQTGGAAGKRGARYEDYFATSKLVAFTPSHLRHNRNMRMREQTGGPVDDLTVRTWRDEFYQLKDAQQVSWSAENRKLAKEFELQDWVCRQPGPYRRYRLMLVVSDEQVRRRLRQTMPKSIRPVTSVVHFPRIARPADLAQPGNKLEPILRSIAAASKPGLTDLQHIAVCFHAAWVNHVPDISGFCVYSESLAFVRGLRAARIRAPFAAPAR